MNGDLLVVWLCWCFRQIITMISLGCRLRSRVSEEQWGGGESCADSHRQGPTLSPGCVLIRGRNTRWRRPVVRQTLPSLVTDLSLCRQRKISDRRESERLSRVRAGRGWLRTPCLGTARSSISPPRRRPPQRSSWRMSINGDQPGSSRR